MSSSPSYTGPGNYATADKEYHPSAFLSIDPGCAAARYWKQTGRPDTLKFQYLDPDANIQDSVPAEWASVGVLGRSEKYYIYASTDNRAFSLNLRFHANSESRGEGLTPRDVRDNALWVMALAYPHYINESRSVPPPTVLFSFGDLMSVRRVLVQNPQVTWEGPWTVGDSQDQLLPFAAAVSLSMVQVGTSPSGFDAVLENRQA